MGERFRSPLAKPMDDAARILLLLEAHDIVGRAGIRASRPEPVVVDLGHASFGTIGGAASFADLQDLVTLWEYRMGQMANSFGAFSPTWVQRDANGFIDWSSDWAALQKRYDPAHQAATSALSAAVYTPIPNAVNPAGSLYTNLQKAMRKCAPPDGCPVVKGDWADLFARLTAAQKALGSAPVVDAPPQPTAMDADLSLYSATAPLDLVAQVTGQQKAGPLPTNWLAELDSVLAWMKAHREALVLGGAVVAGGVVLGLVLPMLLAPLKAAKTLAAVAAA